MERNRLATESQDLGDTLAQGSVIRLNTRPTGFYERHSGDTLSSNLRFTHWFKDSGQNKFIQKAEGQSDGNLVLENGGNAP